VSDTNLCFWCGSALDAYAEVEFKGDKTIVCKCPTDGEYVILPSLSEVLAHVRPEERAMIQQRLEGFAMVADEGDRLELSRLFVEGITNRSLDAP
jgi:hypothetical protein